MLLAHTKLVTPTNGPRPAGKPDRCFYCGELIGNEHKPSCPCRVKVVQLKVELILPVVVPEYWDADAVDFHFNDSSWCADNIANELVRYMEAKSYEAGCLCSSFEGTFIRDAEPEDLEGIDTVALAAGR